MNDILLIVAASILFVFSFIVLLVLLFSPFLYPVLLIAALVYLANRFKLIKL